MKNAPCGAVALRLYAEKSVPWPNGISAAGGGTISLILGQGDCVQRRHSDEDKLKQFSYRIFQIKFIVFETVLLACFLFVLYQVVKREFGF
jgi:hypothetical protein